ncbi:MAG: hypothetical protein EXR79_15880 [Myxococcales bacterium]|nr:hypothetical protein [Myxococcales bacterium]
MKAWFAAAPQLTSMNDADLRDAHVTLQKHLRWLSRGIPLAVLLIILSYVLMIRSTVQAVSGEELAAAFEKQATRIAPRIEQRLTDIGDRVTPHLADALAKQASAILPKFSERVEEEMQLAKKELPDKMTGIVLKELHAAGEYQIQLLEASFPELKGDRKKVERFTQALEMGFQKWAGDLLAQTFHKHIVEFGNIKKTLNELVAKEAAGMVAAQQAAQKDGKVVADTRVQPEQLVGLWLEVFEQAVEGNGESDLLTAKDRAELDAMRREAAGRKAGLNSPLPLPQKK